MIECERLAGDLIEILDLESIIVRLFVFYDAASHQLSHCQRTVVVGGVRTEILAASFTDSHKRSIRPELANAKVGSRRPNDTSK